MRADLNPWDDDPERLNQQALDDLLSGAETDETKAPETRTPSPDPVNAAMPVTDPGPRAPMPDIPVGNNSGLTTATTQPSVFQGFTPKYAMEGFDWNREQNTGKSAKDAFAYLANQAPPPPLNDKAALAGWFNQYIAPGMNALGHNVSNVNGDVFHLQNWQGDFDVDYGRGAGADGGALAWQVQDTAKPDTHARYTPKGPPKPSTSYPAGWGVPGDGQPFPQTLPQGPVPNTGGGDQSAIDRVMAEIQALLAGQSTPMDQQALMEALR